MGKMGHSPAAIIDEAIVLRPSSKRGLAPKDSLGLNRKRGVIRR